MEGECKETEKDRQRQDSGGVMGEGVVVVETGVICSFLFFSST